MGQEERTLLYLGSSDLEYRQNNCVEFSRMAKAKAVEKNHKIKAFQAQERLDFMRAITCGHTIDNGDVRGKVRIPTLALKKLSLLSDCNIELMLLTESINTSVQTRLTVTQRRHLRNKVQDRCKNQVTASGRSLSLFLQHKATRSISTLLLFLFRPMLNMVT